MYSLVQRSPQGGRETTVADCSKSFYNILLLKPNLDRVYRFKFDFPPESLALKSMSFYKFGEHSSPEAELGPRWSMSVCAIVLLPKLNLDCIQVPECAKINIMSFKTQNYLA